MKKILIILIIFLFVSCTRRQARPYVIGMVYDSLTLRPIDKVKISRWEGYKRGFVKEVVTDNNGIFTLKRKHKLMKVGCYLINVSWDHEISGQNYYSKVISIPDYGDTLKLDSIFLRPTEQDSLSY